MVSHQSEMSINSFIDESTKAPGLKIITFFFQFFPEPAVWVIGFYSLMFIWTIYFILDKYDAHKWGILVLFISLMLFQSWDWIKQSAALSMVFLGFMYADKGKLKMTIILFAIAIVFHLSAIFAIPALLCMKLNFSSKWMALFLVVVLIMAVSGVFKSLYSEILRLSPIYGESYSESRKYAEQENYSYNSTTFWLYSIWFILNIFFAQAKTHFWNCLLFVGAILYMISGGSLIIDRVSIYYTISQLIVFPSIMNAYQHSVVKNIMLGMIILLLFLINSRLLSYGDLRRCTPYETIFSEEFRNRQFRIVND